MKVKLRNTSNKMVNLPEEYWKDMGWNINDDLDIEFTFEQPDGRKKNGIHISKRGEQNGN